MSFNAAGETQNIFLDFKRAGWSITSADFDIVNNFSSYHEVITTNCRMEAIKNITFSDYKSKHFNSSKPKQPKISANLVKTFKL